MHFNPRSPHGERHLALIHSDREKLISIHAPRTGSDSSWGSICAATGHFNPRSPHGERPTPKGGRQIFLAFQSTLPARGATALANPQRSGEDISIHAPRTGSDRYHSTLRVNPIYFNPRSPHGERLFTIPFIALTSDFNPRSPHGERRPTLSFRPRHGGYFNPRSPHGERPSHSLLHDFDKHFNPRSPHGERPFLPCAAHAPYSNFNPRSPHGERLTSG